MTSPEVIFKSGTPAVLTPHTILKPYSKEKPNITKFVRLLCYMPCLTSKRINIEHLEEQSDIIIYIVGLIIIIIWKITAIW